MDKKIILFGAGLTGKEALDFFGSRNVYCFADNFNKKRRYYGKKIISFDELLCVHENYEIIISTDYPLVPQLSLQLDSHNLEYKIFKDIYHDTWDEIPGITKYKNIHQGERIFLIGNGPSLLIEDLETLKANNVKTFACNFINRLFDKTSWRPDYYCCVETSAILLNKDFILNSPQIIKFVKEIGDTAYADEFNNVVINDSLNFLNNGGVRHKFSEDVAKVVYDGHTVMFQMIQFAVYMGFKEIYLLGVDNTQPPYVHTSNFIESNSHFYEENKEELEKRREIMVHVAEADDWNLYQSRTSEHYQLAKDYGDEHGIKIFNATRGGILEVYERKDFDRLFN